MRNLLRATIPLLAGAAFALSSAAAFACDVCLLKKPGTNLCLMWSHACVASKVPYHFRQPSPIQSKAPQVYRHYPSHR